MGKTTKLSRQRADFFSRLYNAKFTSALELMVPELQLDEHSQELVKWLAAQFGNSGWILGDFDIVISAALRSIPGYVESFGDKRGSSSV